MLYYTQLIYIKPGREETFHRFEDHVLPLLEKYNGKLVLRWRRIEGCVIETSFGNPYEIHVVSFETADDFTNYKNDKTRMEYLPLKDESVEKIVLIEGKQL